MSRVFLAEETALKRRVVIKVLPAELAAEVNAERFRREIQLAAKLQHPYIVPVLATGVAGGLPYFTMPFVEGESLRAHLQRAGELPVPEAIAIIRDVLEALSYAHECGVVHRDIKPENVLLARHHAHVADFGVAKALSASTNAQSGLTSLGVALGTPAYMAPEQAMADPSTDHRADLYAVGAMAYEMLTGYQLFSQRSPQAMLAAHATEAPEPVERRRPNIPAPLAALVMRLLEKRPADRVQSANEALTHLAAATTPSGGMAPTAQYATPATAPRARARAGVWVAVGVGIAVAIGAGGYFRNRQTGSSDAAASSQGPSIAVMPFANMSGDPKNDYLGDGLSEELIGGLSRVRGLQVAARTSSFAFKGKNEDIRSIGTKLGVSSVLGGSVRRAGNKLRVSVQLTSVSTGYNLWSESYDRDMSDVFAVEDEISKAIVSALALRLAAAPNAAPIVQQTTSDPVAYDLYLKGRYAWQQRGPHLFEAKDHFAAAVARDSGFALAWSGLADTYATMSSWGYVTALEAKSKSIPYAQRAVVLAPSLAEPHASLGFTLCQLKRDYQQGIAELERAVEINPSSGTAHYLFSLCLLVAGHSAEAITHGLEAQRLEPLNAQFITATTRAYAVAHNLPKALELGAAAQRMAPKLGSVYASMMWVFASTGDTAKVRWSGETSAGLMSANKAGINSFIALIGHDRAALLREQPEVSRRTPAAGIYMAGGYAMIHNADSTLAWIDRAYAVDGDVLGVIQYPIFDWLRSDPRFIALQKKYNIPSPQP